eukprot:TRINITY_DN29472_c0_g1_i1.p1 TRINITY_DN29472_c0_g1~~TRINITY_DN29472_c0_g1_i1.p1  ORF type:complete len:613 (-),score=196.42 TRINITY_DN29472_c0_g1_i1:183-2021(-)
MAPKAAPKAFGKQVVRTPPEERQAMQLASEDSQSSSSCVDIVEPSPAERKKAAVPRDAAVDAKRRIDAASDQLAKRAKTPGGQEQLQEESKITTTSEVDCIDIESDDEKPAKRAARRGRSRRSRQAEAATARQLVTQTGCRPRPQQRPALGEASGTTQRGTTRTSSRLARKPRTAAATTSGESEDASSNVRKSKRLRRTGNRQDDTDFSPPRGATTARRAQVSSRTTLPQTRQACTRNQVRNGQTAETHVSTGKRCRPPKQRGTEHVEKEAAAAAAASADLAEMPAKARRTVDSKRTGKEKPVVAALPAAAEETREDVNLFVGAGVVLHSLQSRSDLNGCRGKLQSFCEDSGRWCVELKGKEPVNVKATCIRLLPSPSKTKVAEGSDVAEECEEEEDWYWEEGGEEEEKVVDECVEPVDEPATVAREARGAERAAADVPEGRPQEFGCGLPSPTSKPRSFEPGSFFAEIEAQAELSKAREKARAVATASAAEAATAPATNQEPKEADLSWLADMGYKEGVVATIHSLVDGEAALNGSKAKLLRFEEADMVWEVSLEDGSGTRRLKLTNLLVPEALEDDAAQQDEDADDWHWTEEGGEEEQQETDECVVPETK